MKRFTRMSFSWALCLVVLLTIPLVVFADTITADADVVLLGDQASKDLGNVTPGQVLTPKVSFKLVCAGKNHVDSGQTVNLAFSLSASTVPAGGSLSATNASIGSIPASWPDDTTGGGSTNCTDPAPTLDDNGDSTVTITAPTAPGTYSYVVKYNVSLSPSGSGDPQAITGSAPPATFTLNVVAPADTTPPVITANVAGTLGNNGWYVSDVTVSWSVTDPESAITSTSGCGSTTINADTPGQTLTCSATSAGGTNSQSVTIKRDATAPTISGSASPAPNGAGWNNTDVTVSFTCADNLSGVASCGPDQTLSGEGAGQSASGTAIDNAGNSASATVGGINIDKTAPTISGSASPAPNANGWNNGDVTVSFTCGDSLSGVVSCGPNQTLSSEGANQSASGTAVDNAGNSTSATVSSINIDKSAPTVTVTGVTNGATYTLGSVPAAGCSTTDALSGVATSASLSTSGGPVVGTFIATCSGASDNAGNNGSASATYNVIYNWNGFFRPVDNLPTLNQVKAGSAIPVKFSLNGNQGLNIFTAGYPKSQKIDCDTSASIDNIEETVTAGSSSLSYDPTADQYNYVWKTDKAWGGTCRQLTVMLNDGTSHMANFNFTK